MNRSQTSNATLVKFCIWASERLFESLLNITSSAPLQKRIMRPREANFEYKGGKGLRQRASTFWCSAHYRHPFSCAVEFVHLKNVKDIIIVFDRKCQLSRGAGLQNKPQRGSSLYQGIFIRGGGLIMCV